MTFEVTFENGQVLTVHAPDEAAAVAHAHAVADEGARPNPCRSARKLRDAGTVASVTLVKP